MERRSKLAGIFKSCAWHRNGGVAPRRGARCLAGWRNDVALEESMRSVFGGTTAVRFAPEVVADGQEFAQGKVEAELALRFVGWLRDLQTDCYAVHTGTMVLLLGRPRPGRGGSI